MPHILLICTANICRSPVAEALLRQKLAGRQLTVDQGWIVSSAGTWAVQKRPAASESIQLMDERGLDITDHRAQMVDEAMIAGADLALCMTASHAEALRVEFPKYAGKIHLLTALVGKQYDISDPYGGPIDEYERMVSEVDSLLTNGLDWVVTNVQKND